MPSETFKAHSTTMLQVSHSFMISNNNQPQPLAIISSIFQDTVNLFIIPMEKKAQFLKINFKQITALVFMSSYSEVTCSSQWGNYINVCGRLSINIQWTIYYKQHFIGLQFGIKPLIWHKGFFLISILKAPLRAKATKFKHGLQFFTAS